MQTIEKPQAEAIADFDRLQRLKLLIDQRRRVIARRKRNQAELEIYYAQD